jgi:hypothetical protein
MELTINHFICSLPSSNFVAKPQKQKITIGYYRVLQHFFNIILFSSPPLPLQLCKND